MSDQDSLLQRLESELHKPVGPYKGWDAVNRVMIRHWCEVLGDDNPVYTDPEYAAASPHGAIVAPPTMLQSWTMRGYNDRHPPGSSEKDSFSVLTILEEAGYPAVVAVNCDQEYFQYLREGDEVYHTAQIESISEEKTTALGRGFFVTQLCEFFNQRDEKVGTMRFRVFKYIAHERPQAEADKTPEKPAAVKRMRPARNYDNAFFWEGVDEGRLLIQRCVGCETLRHPPAPACPQCQSLEWDTVESTGRGEVYSYVVMHHPPIPPFDYPNVIALVELEEGTRLITQLIGIERDDVRIGLPVEVTFEDVEEGLRLPLFRPRGDR